MADNTAITWADATFNSWRGCARVSEGCRFCYAETMSARNHKTLGVWGPNGTRVVAAGAMWKEPLKWDRLAAEGKLPDGTPNPDGHRPRVFCASLSDVFEEWLGSMVNSAGEKLFQCCQCQHQWAANVDDYDPTKQDKRVICQRCLSVGPNDMTMQDVRRRLFALIDATPNLDWLLLTKRPENITRMTPTRDLGERTEGIAEGDYGYHNPEHAFTRPNCWFGTSVENQAAADERIPHILRVPAAVRFLSMEPLLGPVNLGPWINDGETPSAESQCPKCGGDVAAEGDGWRCVEHRGIHIGCGWRASYLSGEEPDLRDGINWVIVGGESGSGHRPMQVEWAQDLADQCKAAGVKCFIKQDSGHRPGQQGRLPLALFNQKEFPCSQA